MTTSVKRWGRRVVHVVLGFSILMLVVLAIAPRSGLYRTLTVLTGSMEPAIPAGSVIVVTPTDPRELSVGDVIVYNPPLPGRPVMTHRIVELVQRGENPVVRTKGDANAAPDPWTARLDGGPVWQMRFAVPALGNVVRALRAPWVRMSTVYGVPVLLSLIWLSEIWRRPARQRSEDHGPAQV